MMGNVLFAKEIMNFFYKSFNGRYVTKHKRENVLLAKEIVKKVFFERHNVKCIFMKDKMENNIFEKMFIFGKTYWKSLFANAIFFTEEKIEKVRFFET